MDKPSAAVLAHYGVKGMRWGFRKRSDGSYQKTGRTAKTSEDHDTAQAIKKKHVSEMSNAELRRLNERLQLERTYAQLTTSQKNKVDKGNRVAKDILGVAKTAQEVYNVVNSPAGKAARELLKNK